MLGGGWQAEAAGDSFSPHVHDLHNLRFYRHYLTHANTRWFLMHLLLIPTRNACSIAIEAMRNDGILPPVSSLR